MSVHISIRKLIQKRLYDIVSHKYGVFITLLVILLTFISALQFGETVLEWSREKYASVFNSFSDNLGGRSYREKLCSPVPIDAVYTWVNGSDPTLLQALSTVKHEFEEKMNISSYSISNATCKFSNCIAINKIVLEGHTIPNISLEDLKLTSSSFQTAKIISSMKSPLHNNLFISFVSFNNESHIKNIFNILHKVHLNNQSIPLKRVYITSDKSIKNSIVSKDKLVISGYPAKFSSSEILQNLPEKHQKSIKHIELFEEKGFGVITVEDHIDLDSLQNGNFTFDGKKPTLNNAHYVWDLRDMSRSDDISASRFEDNEELKYSLRSLERFAPWIRHVYVVTNGQMPHWMNMDSPKLTVITHEEIFPNKSHLPTFSSPAIETHLHRIPGLSDKFIYLNDDVIFGKEVWPEDFFTDSKGQKVYLTWPIPNCNEGCPGTWILDGYCDKACNNSECEWDGGDCSGSSSQIQPGAGWGGAFHSWNSGEQQKLYCSTGCANSWLADKYCDTACNSEQCAFDAGDCGIDHFSKIHQVSFLKDENNYILPPGVTIFFFNITQMFSSNFSIEEASYEKHDVIRTAAVSLKFRVMTVLLYEGFNSSKLHFELKTNEDKGNATLSKNFTVIVDTFMRKHIGNDSEDASNEFSNDTSTILTNKTNSKDHIFKFEDIPLGKRYPNAKNKFNFHLPLHKNETEVTYQERLRKLLQEFTKQLDDGDITEKGFKARKKSISDYLTRNKLKKQDEKTKIKIMEQQKYNKQVFRKSQKQGAESPIIQKRNLLSVTNSLSTEKDLHERTNSLLHWEGGDAFNFSQSDEMLGQSQVLFKVIKSPHGKFSSQYNRTWNNRLVMNDYKTPSVRSRKTLDTFGDSLKHVNKLYNKAFGYAPRKVPGHMPHMIDKHIMSELQDRFPEEWDLTSFHKIRQGDDMQYAFAYFYYLMGVSKEVTAEEIFAEMDTDKSNVLSDREIRTLATKIYDLPLDLPSLVSIENIFINCSQRLPLELQMEYPGSPLETYYDKNMPQVTRNLFIGCTEMIDMLKKKFTTKGKYKYETLDDSEIAFKMIKTNVSGVVGQLDDIRKNPKKFICLNDNIDHSREEDAKTVKAILQDFYEAILPIPSQFELPRDYRNRFLHIKELNEWKRYRDWLKFWAHVALIILVVYTVLSYFGDKIEAMQRRFSRRLRRMRSEKVKNVSEDVSEQKKDSMSTCSSSSDSDQTNSRLSSIITL